MDDHAHPVGPELILVIVGLLIALFVTSAAEVFSIAWKVVYALLAVGWAAEEAKRLVAMHHPSREQLVQQCAFSAATPGSVLLLGLIVGWRMPLLAVLVSLAVHLVVERVRFRGRGLRLPWSRGKRAPSGSTLARALDAPDPLPILHERIRRCGAGAYLGAWHEESGEPWLADARSAAGILGPSGSGKSRAIVTPSLLAHPGPALSTSTKLDIVSATIAGRRRGGTTYLFDPLSSGLAARVGAVELRWSPVDTAADYDRAQRTAARIVGAASRNVRQEDAHFTPSAEGLIAVLLHAAALGGARMRDVLAWVNQGDAMPAGALLAPGSLAADLLAGIVKTPEKELGGIWSTSRRLLAAYRSDRALRSTDPPEPGEAGVATLDAAAFVASSADTIYVAIEGDEAKLRASIVVGMIGDVVAATFAASAEIRAAGRGECRHPPVLLSLDEAANIAPIHDLPYLLSVGGGLGLHVLVVLQDLSQIDDVWGPAAARGMLSHWPSFVVLPGIRDTDTTRRLSELVGDWDRPVATESVGRSASRTISGDVLEGGAGSRTQGRSRGRSITTRRERIIPPERISQMQSDEVLIWLRGRQPTFQTLSWWDEHPVFARIGGPDPVAAVTAPLDEGLVRA